jgi:hypothetical protein
MKKTWLKPELVILIRGRPEEYVLGACKDVGAPDAGPTPIQAGSACLENMVNCEPCNGIAQS